MQGIEREFVGREAADTGMPGVDLNEQAGEPNQVFTVWVRDDVDVPHDAVVPGLRPGMTAAVASVGDSRRRGRGPPTLTSAPSGPRRFDQLRQVAGLDEQRETRPRLERPGLCEGSAYVI